MAGNEFIDGNLSVGGTLGVVGAQTFTGQVSFGGNVVLNSSTSTSAAGAVTLNAKAGIITTETITTTGQSVYTLTITNSSITATDLVLASVGNGSNTTGIAAISSVVPTAGVLTIKVSNAATTATNPFGGSLKIAFVAFK